MVGKYFGIDMFYVFEGCLLLLILSLSIIVLQ